ncbi:MAG: hypothetical protein HFJ51_04250 [Clostridia bacterium]|nr:hypothetical protein [Clostridia bacterium]
MNEELYNYEQVEAFAIIALHNLLRSPNREYISLKNFKMFLEPLPQIHTKDEVIDFANNLQDV